MIPELICDRCGWRRDGACSCGWRLSALERRRLAAVVEARHREALDWARLRELDARRRWAA